MAEPTLTITYDQENYSFRVEIRDPNLAEKYSQRQEDVKERLRAGISEVVADLSLPSNLQRIIDRMHMDSLKRKLKLIEGYRDNGVGEQ